MNSDLQRIAIAEACGWVWVAWGGSPNPTPVEIQKLYAFAWDHPVHGRVGGTRDLPDYLNSLDAMNVAEKILTDEQYFGAPGSWSSHDDDFSFNGWLDRIVGNSTPVDRPVRYKSATAAQRAEAFLKTLNLWKNENA